MVLGITCMVFGQLFHASQNILEEYILKGSGGQEPCYMMGWEGVFGLLITTLVLLPAQFAGCPFHENQCINGHIDDFALALQQMQANKTIIVLAVCFAISATAYNGFGITLTKLTSAANRSVVEQSRVVLIWVFFLNYTGVGHETFSYVKLLGFLMIVVGVVFFN